MLDRKSLLAASALCVAMLLARFVSAAETPADPADPLPAGDPPAFREVLNGGKWDEAFGKATAALGDLDSLARSGLPESGSTILQVDAESQGQRQGLEAGETITEVDGKPLFMRDVWELRTDKDQTITVVASWGEARQISISPGMIGVGLLPFVRPELAFLRHGPRKAAWDAFAAVGAAKCLSDPDVAETAWQHAIAAGYAADELSDFCGMQIAWRQGRNDDALRCFASMERRDDTFPSLSRSSWSRQLAIANFKIRQALSVPPVVSKPHTAPRDQADDYLGGLLKAYQRRPAAMRNLPSPTELAGIHTTNLMDTMTPRLSGDQRDDDWRRYVSNLLAKKGEYHVKAESGHFQRIVEMPRDEAGNVQVTFHVKFTASDDQASEYAKIFAVGLVNCDQEQDTDLNHFPAGGSMLCVTMEPKGGASIRQDSEQQFLVQETWTPSEIGRGQSFTLQLLHAAGRDEVWLNHRRLVYLPSEENPRKIGFFIAQVGTAIEVKADYSRIDIDKH